ncbi:hypothetical protein [Phycicoccus avicenniae]|uniref:hypothetical protein n=1 Tax=Phycicoccus avicenniae TaxID=2828860 RepID=UPI003D2D7FAA
MSVGRAARRPRQGALGVGRLVRRSVRAGAGTTSLMVLVAAVATCFLVVTPRVEARVADRGVVDALTAGAAPEREVRLHTDPAKVAGRPAVSTRTGPGPSAPFAAVDAAVREVMGHDVLRLLGDPSVAATTDLGVLTRPGAALPLGARSVIRIQSGLLQRVDWLEGGPPGAPTARRTITTARGPHTVRLVPVAVPARTAEYWGLKPGDELHLQGPGDLTPAAAVVSGVYAPRDPEDGFWQADRRMVGVAVIATPLGAVEAHAALVAAPASYGAVSDSVWRADTGRSGSPALDASWRYPLVPSRVDAEDVPVLRALMARLDTDPRLDGLTSRTLTTTSGLPGVLDRYDAALRSVSVLRSFVGAGLTALVALLLAFTAVTAVRLGRPGARLLRARGGSVGQVLVPSAAGPAAAISAVLVVSAVTGWLLPGRWDRLTVLELVLLALAPVLAAVGAVVLDLRRAEDADSTDLAARRAVLVRRARRVVGEVAVLAGAVLAVTTARARGQEIASGRTDWLVSLTPVLVAAAGAVIALRVLPWPVRTAARLARRGRGLVAFLGLSRSARTGGASALPVVAVVVGAAVLALSASLVISVRDQRDVAALRDVGGPVRVDAVRVDPDDVEALLDRPGVMDVVPAYVEEGTVIDRGVTTQVLVVGADPTAYARLLAGTAAPLAAVPAEGTGDAARLPAVVGPGVGEGRELSVGGVRVDIEPTAVDPSLVRRSGGREVPAVLVPLDRLGEAVSFARPHTAFVAADTRGTEDLLSADPATVTPSDRVTGVRAATDVVERVGDLALPRFVAWTYAVGAALAVLLILLAVALLLEGTRHERATLVIRLRTMGLPHGAERSLAWTEVLPVVLVATVAGVVVGSLAPVLVGPAVDLSPVTGGLGRPPLEPHVAPALAAGALVLVVAVLALVVDAAHARGGALAEHLRRGATA